MTHKSFTRKTRHLRRVVAGQPRGVTKWFGGSAQWRICALQHMFHTRYISLMEQTPPSRLSSSERRAQARAFGDWLRARMIERDYNLSVRGGGQRRLAEQTGLSEAAISRLLNGETLTPDPESLRLIAAALALPLGTVLVHAGIITAEDLRAIQGASSDRPPLTLEEAAADLDISDPVAIDMFEAGVDAARKVQEKRRRPRAE